MGTSRGVGGRGTSRRGGSYGYSDSAPPTLGGDGNCLHHVLCQHLQVFLAEQLLMAGTLIRDIRCTAKW